MDDRREFELVLRVITDERLLVTAVGFAVLWRAFVSSDKEISTGECLLSCLSLLTVGWLLMAYLYSNSRQPTYWPVSGRIYRGIAIALLVINIYIAIYYGLRGCGCLRVEVSVRRDFIYRDATYVLFMMYYCATTGILRYLKEMQRNYRLLIREGVKKEVMKGRSRSRGRMEAIFRLFTRGRTLVMILSAAILWRAAITIDGCVTFWESTYSGISLAILGWFLFGYLCALAIKSRRKHELRRVIQGVAMGLCAVNIYSVSYYALRWYELLCGFMEEEPVCKPYVPPPADILLRDVLYVLIILFYCTFLLLSKHLETAYHDYVIPASTGARSAQPP